MISVVIAAYNGEKYILKQLLSIKNQALPVDEVIICDDRSTDNTVEICNKFIKENSLSGWYVAVNEKNLGYCMNYYGGISKAKGDIIFLCDQDDEWYQNKTEVMCKVLEENDDIKVLSSRYDIINQESHIIENSGITYLGKRFDGSIEYLSLESFIGCSYIRGFATAFKSELKPFIKPIDVGALLAHDWFINSIGAIKGKSAIINTKLCSYRYHGDNVSLSDMTRKTFLGDRSKRLKGLSQSIEAHSYLLNEFSGELTKKQINSYKKMIALEKKRLKFLKTKNPLYWLLCGFYPGSLSRYYKSTKGGIRVFLGDFFYCYNINFKK